MKYNKLFYFGLGFIFVSHFSHAARPVVKRNKISQNSIGFLAKVSGVVLVNGKPAKSGDKISINSEITTKNNGKLQILIGNGIVAAVGFDTQIHFEKYGIEKSKMNAINKEIEIEKAQFDLRRGSLRVLVAKENDVIRMATVHSGDVFGIAQNGEVHFLCDANCAAKVEAVNSKSLKPKSQKKTN